MILPKLSKTYKTDYSVGFPELMFPWNVRGRDDRLTYRNRYVNQANVP